MQWIKICSLIYLLCFFAVSFYKKTEEIIPRIRNDEFEMCHFSVDYQTKSMFIYIVSGQMEQESQSPSLPEKM